MAGYTRQSSSSIASGQSVAATPLNNEFNQVQAAFDASSGHNHDGSTSGNGPKIALTTSVSGYLPLANGGVAGKNNATTSNPAVGDDTADGYNVGSFWGNTSTDGGYLCYDASSGAAVWKEIVHIDASSVATVNGLVTATAGLHTAGVSVSSGTTTLATSHLGSFIFCTGSGTKTIRLPDASSTYSGKDGGHFTIVNIGTGVATIDASTNSQTLYWASGASATTTGNRSLAGGGVCTVAIASASADQYAIFGSGLS